MEITRILKELCLVGAPSGFESEIVELSKKYMNAFGECKVDNRGNFICTKKGEGLHFLLDAHMDQIGFVVTSIEDGGFLRVSKVGGIDRRIAPSQEVVVLGKEKVYGVIGCKPPHLTDESEKDKAPKFEDLFIDTGLDKESLCEKVEIGDFVVFKPYFEKLLGSNFTGTAIDDRAGMAIIIRAMEILNERGSKSAVTAVFSVQEEVNGKGAGNASFYAEADEAIAVDVSFASQPEVSGSKKNATMPLGGGAFIGFAPILDRSISKGFVNTAKRKNIPYSVEVMGGRTGTNADEIVTAKLGTKTVTISPPIRNMHTTVEIVNGDDLENCARLIAEYILSNEEK